MAYAGDLIGARGAPLGRSRMKLRYALCSGLALLFAFGSFAAADEFTPAQKEELGVFIKDYLVAHPDVLREAIEALDKHDKQVAEDERQKAVSDQAGELFSSKFQATVGNL